MSVEILWSPLLWQEIGFIFSTMVSGNSLIIGEKNISVFDGNPFRILEIPNVSIFQMMNIFWMVREYVRQDWLKPRLWRINEGVGDEEFDM